MTNDPASLPYRPCVGVMVLNRDNKIFLGRRIPEPQGEMDGAAKLWQMPQGGIDQDENPRLAAERELYEETGIRSVELLAQTPDWLTYELPPELVGIALKGKFRGQKQMWFAFRFLGEDSEIAIDPPPGGHSAEFDEWAWKTMDEALDLVVPFKREVYERVIAAFRHLEGQG
ncbi:RNA pyrophosphohydrolase [Aureimonas sp. AU40]|uniref:RNA pyrophosphohydrolase n=1 Tax=Aureimonas sp. AU40 TaxID=1637747 RepID=UPI000B135F47|nr:RNA pyrophosphohydrolase [Aureimonas sp. AU40]